MEKDNVTRKLLNPLYGLSTACKDWYETIRDFLSNECVGWGVTSLDKSVFFRTQQGFDYCYGEGFRGKNTPNLYKGILKVGENFETRDTRKVLGIIDIRVGDLLISGSEDFIEYISLKMKENSGRVDMR